MNGSQTDEALPAHIEDTIGKIARLHAEHRVGATPVQKGVEAITRFMSRPRAAVAAALAVMAWVGLNLAFAAARSPTLDPPPFAWLQSVVSVVALLMTIFILISQRRENELDDLRAQLTLELAVLAEQKSAKVIALLEELRSDLPSVPDRHDPEAHELAKRAEPEVMLEALKDTAAEAPRPDAKA